MKKNKRMPKEIKVQNITVYDRIFSQKVTVLINHTPDSLVKWMNKNKIEDMDTKSFTQYAGWTSEYEDKEGAVFALIFIPRFQWTIKNQGILIHEITHAVIKIWSRNNIPYNADTQEFLAHSIGNMYEDISRGLLK